MKGRIGLLLVLLNCQVMANQHLLGDWETTDQYGYGFMTMHSMESGNLTFYDGMWANSRIDLELTDFKEDEDGFMLNIRPSNEGFEKFKGTMRLENEMLCLKFSFPEEPNLMCFMRPDRVDQLRTKAREQLEKTQ